MEQKSHGALIGSFIIIIILVIGGLYFWQTSVKEKLEPVNPNTNIGTTQNESDSTINIENDLNNTNLDNLDKAI